jgi:hypothetical protein
MLDYGLLTDALYDYIHKSRGKHFRDEEDILLVSKWLNVGMDPIQGVDQRHGTLWTNT